MSEAGSAARGPTTPPRGHDERDDARRAPKAPARVGFGCSLAGAYNVVGQVSDAATVMHGDAGCAHLSLATHLSTDWRSAADEGDAERCVAGASRLLTTDLRERDAIFGAENKLRRAVVEADRRLAPAAIFVIGACVAEVIGEDVTAIAAQAQAEVGARVIPLVSGGVCSGSFASGASAAYRTLVGEIVERGVPVEPLTVNVLAEKNLYVGEEREFAEIRRLLDLLSIRVNCRFVRRATLADLRTAGRAALNLPREREGGVPLARLLEDRCGTPWLDRDYPSGRTATADWLREVAEALGVGAAPRETAVAETDRRYSAGLAGPREALAGKRAVLNAGGDPLWAIELATDAGLRIEKVNLLGSPDPAVARSVQRTGLPTSVGVTAADAITETRALAPDLTLFPYGQAPYLPSGAARCLPSIPPTGLRPLGELSLWARLVSRPGPEGWRR